jgi:release factor glutamine methyltransferase
MTIREAYKHTVARLSGLYDAREAASISDWVMEHLTGFGKTERLLHSDTLLRATQESSLNAYLGELEQYKPVQYVLHEAWFAAMKLYVNEQVLIPRPETEELVEWVVQSNKEKDSLRIIDIGTGSGCIPVALQKQLPIAEIHALDISAGALEVALKNARIQQANIHFHQADILQKANWSTLPLFDCIVSNPPYIKLSEKQEMHENVLSHEPHLALFVPDNDPLVFYQAIAGFAAGHLQPGGQLYFEINEALGKETIQLLADKGFTAIELKKDLQGKNRMVKALLPG